MERKKCMENSKMDFAEKLKEIADGFLTFANFNIPEVSGGYSEQLKNTVYGLLDFDKPKVMVYGIYNSGKSTLINALMQQEVAEMADRPMTDTISEFDHGDYILVDSPGVDAPIQHEKVTNEFLNRCHIILFVISSKGGFESKYNYQRMAELINRDIPFIIVLNERGCQINKEWSQEEKELRRAEHAQELKSIQYKIIDNLKKVTGDKRITDKYEVYILNAKKALRGIQKNNQKLYAASNIEALDKRIVQLIQSGSALKVLRQPLTNLKACMDDAETYIAGQMHDGDSDFEEKINILRKKQENLKDEMRLFVRQETGSRVEEIASLYAGGAAESAEGVEYDIIGAIRERYDMKLKDLNFQIHKLLGDDAGCDIPELTNMLDVELKKKDYASRNMEIKEEEEELAPKEKEKKGLFDFLKSRSRREKEKYERMEREAALVNAKNENRLNEQIRVRQEARQAASSDMFELQNLIISAVNEDIALQFDGLMDQIHAIDSQNKEQIEEGKRKLADLDAFRKELDDLENTIA